MIVGICPGHSIAAPGAAYGGMTEQAWCRRIVDAATRLAAGCSAASLSGISVFDPRSDLEPVGYPGYLVRRMRAYGEARPDCAIDVHLNACGDPSASYSVVVYGADAPPRSRCLAEAIAAEFDRAFSWPSRGAVTDASLGRRLGFVRRMAMPAVIVEPLFLSNAAARAWLAGSDGIERVAEAIMAGVAAWGAGGWT